MNSKVKGMKELFKIQLTVYADKTGSEHVGFIMEGAPMLISARSKAALRTGIDDVMDSMANADIKVAEYMDRTIEHRQSLDELTEKEKEDIHNEWMKEFTRVYGFIS